MTSTTNTLKLIPVLISDVNECQNGEHNCHANAECSDNDGSYTCDCLPGSSGDGFDCQSL